MHDTPSPFPAVYLDVEQFPGAVRPSGTYTIEGDMVTVSLALGRDAEALSTFRVRGSLAHDLAGLTSRIVEAILEAVAKTR